MYVIQNISMANYLITHGCPLLKIDSDKKDKYRLIFLFEKNESLLSTMSKFSKYGGSENDCIGNRSNKVE